MGIPGRMTPLIAHVVFRFDYGGLENGIVNLINRLPADRYRHAIVCLNGFSEEFCRRLQRTDVEVVSIDKRPGKDLPAYGRMWRVLRRLQPAIVHTRNIGTMDMQWVAAGAGVPHRVHGEHGWNPADPQGLDPRNLRLRRACRPVVHRYVAMSRDIEQWLIRYVGVSPHKVHQLYNGVDSTRFNPAGPVPSDVPWPPHGLVIGTVGRLDPIKNHIGLLRAFAEILERRPDLRPALRLVVVGDGPERARLAGLVDQLRLVDHAWLSGARQDTPDLMRAMDVFVLPSINEGISNTILEAMATGLPVVAGRVGGNPELVVEGVTGTLYDAQSLRALEDALIRYLEAPALRETHGKAARDRAVQEFSLDAMVGRYMHLYDELLSSASLSRLAGEGQGEGS